MTARDPLDGQIDADDANWISWTKTENFAPLGPRIASVIGQAGAAENLAAHPGPMRDEAPKEFIGGFSWICEVSRQTISTTA